VPATTDPVADAATHIAALADAIAVRLTSRSTAYWAGVVITDANGDFLVPGIAGVLSHCAGAVVADNASGAHLFMFVWAGPPNNAAVRVRTATGAAVGQVAVDVAVIAWGTPA